MKIFHINGTVLCEDEALTIKETLNNAIKAGVSLSGADLSDADLRCADLSGAYLSGAYLRGANLHGASLSGANLSGANLSGAQNFNFDSPEFQRTRILPEGSIIGWKKCYGGTIVKLRIPEEAKRSQAFGRKCRAEYADVLEIVGETEAYSMHDGGKTIYRVGERVYPDGFSDNWQEECAQGIHFFITRAEAQDY